MDRTVVSKALEDFIFTQPKSGGPTLTYNVESEKFFWVFYAGMGTADYHQVNDWDSGYLQACINFQHVIITDQEIKVRDVYKGLKIIPYGP